MKISKNTIAFITVVVLLSLSSLISLRMFFRERTEKDLLDIRSFPRQIGNWIGRDIEVTEREYDILETRNLISREYVNTSGERLYLFVIYSETNRSVFHPPEVCLMGSGVRILNKVVEEVNAGRRSFTANKIYAEKGADKQLILYSYKAGRLYTDNFYLQQIYFAFNQLFGKHRGGATIRVLMPIGRDEEATLAVLKSFMNETIEIMEELL